MALIAARPTTRAAQAADAAADASMATREVRSCATAVCPGMELSLNTTETISCDYLWTVSSPEIRAALSRSIYDYVERYHQVHSKFTVNERKEYLPVYNTMVTTRWAASDAPRVDTAWTEAAAAAGHARAARATSGALAPDTAVVYHHFELIQTLQFVKFELQNACFLKTV